MSSPWDEADDMPGDPKEDLQKLREVRNRDQSWEPPAILEGAFVGLTALVGVVWFFGLFLFDVSGTTWMGFGALGGIMFGVPAAIFHALRNGGVEVIRRTVQQYIG